MECKRHQKIKEKWSCCKRLDDYEMMSNEQRKTNIPKISSTVVSVAQYECHQRTNSFVANSAVSWPSIRQSASSTRQKISEILGSNAYQ